MSARAILRLLETCLLFAAFSVMVFLCIWILLPRFRIDISRTELLTTFPTPRLTTTGTNIEIFAIGRKTTRKNVITGVVFETPTLAPGTLFCVHLTWAKKGFWDFKQGN
jgi:hypothetical protein